jgi:hypothetical protein
MGSAAVTFRLAWGSTFDVFDWSNERRLGQISLMSSGWAAYAVGASGRIMPERLGTFGEAEIAVLAITGTMMVPQPTLGI